MTIERASRSGGLMSSWRVEVGETGTISVAAWVAASMLQKGTERSFCSSARGSAKSCRSSAVTQETEKR